MRPSYSRRPSHTASPPCTAESNGLTRASSRWESRPPTLTTMSRLRSSKVCCNGSPSELEPVCRQRLVVGQAALQKRFEVYGQRLVVRDIRREAGRGPDTGIPVL